jgi:hypothetical protein
MATAEAVLAAAEKDLGYREGATTKFGVWYAALPGHAGQGFESGSWCDMAVSKWAADSGNGPVVGCFAYVPFHMNWFKQQGIWHPGASGVRRGDVICFDWNADGTPDHIGYVLGADAAGVHTIEGNTAGVPDRVAHQVRHPSQIEGYGRPRYGGAAAADPVLRLGSNGPDVARAQGRLNAWGASPKLAPDSDFGPATDRAVRAFQSARKLGADGEIGPATWAALNKAPPAPARPAAAAGGRHHGEWVAAGQLSLHNLAGTLGVPVNTLLRTTAVHYGAYNPVLAGYIADVLTGKTPPTARLPKGAALWCD